MRPLQAKSKRQKISIKELLFADDTALVAGSDRQASILLNYQCEENVVMAQGVKNPPVIKLNNILIEVIDNTNQNEYLPGMYPQYTSVRHRNMDKLLWPTKETEQLPSSLLAPLIRNKLDGQGLQRRSPPDGVSPH